MEMKQFLVAGIALALLIGIAAVFLASGDPDGLESTALYVQNEKSITGPSPEDGDAEAIGEGTFEYEAPMPDYGLGDAFGKPGEVVAVLVGTLVALLLVFGVGKAVATTKH